MYVNLLSALLLWSRISLSPFVANPTLIPLPYSLSVQEHGRLSATRQYFKNYQSRCDMWDPHSIPQKSIEMDFVSCDPQRCEVVLEWCESRIYAFELGVGNDVHWYNPWSQQIGGGYVTSTESHKDRNPSFGTSLELPSQRYQRFPGSRYRAYIHWTWKVKAVAFCIKGAKGIIRGTLH